MAKVGSSDEFSGGKLEFKNAKQSSFCDRQVRPWMTSSAWSGEPPEEPVAVAVEYAVVAASTAAMSMFKEARTACICRSVVNRVQGSMPRKAFPGEMILFAVLASRSIVPPVKWPSGATEEIWTLSRMVLAVATG